MVSLDFGGVDIAGRRRLAGRSIHFIWADKVGLVLAAAGLAVIAYLWAVAAIAVGVTGANNLARHEIALGLEIDFLVASLFWVAMTAVDFAIGGPRRRRRSQKH
jgi:hypothetical protein